MRRKPVPRAEYLAARTAVALANRALMEQAAAFDIDSFDDDANASASDRLLALLKRYHVEGDVHA